MKLRLLFFALLVCASPGWAQQFSTTLHFTDAAGNVDSLVVGYDANATMGIDPAFGEENILSVPYNSDLDVRISDEYVRRMNPPNTGTYHTKKQIYPNDCPYWSPTRLVMVIDIKASHWPVQVTWDKSRFTDECRKYALLTDANPCCWFDVASKGGEVIAWLRDTASAGFRNNTTYMHNYPVDYYLNADQDTIRTVYLTVGSAGVLIAFFVGVEETADNELHVFPNPSPAQIRIAGGIEGQKPERIELYDGNGKLCGSSQIDDTRTVSIQAIASGIYYYRIYTTAGQIFSGKMLRE